MFRKEKEEEEEAAIVGMVEGVLDRKVQRPLSSLKESILLVQKSPSDPSFFFLMTMWKASGWSSEAMTSSKQVPL